MTKSLIYSVTFHAIMIALTVLSLPFMTRQPIDLPPIVSVELIQITDKTNIPFAPKKARKIIEDVKKKKKELYQNKLLQQLRPKKSLIGYRYQMKKKRKKS